MSQQEDDLRALAKIMDFLRAVSIILVVMNVYWFCYEVIRLWGVNIGVVDRILLNFDRTAGLFHSILYTKLFAVLLLALSCLGTKGVKGEKITWGRIWTALAAGSVLFFLNWWILALPLPIEAVMGLYVLTIGTGYVCLLMGGLWMSRLLKHNLMEDVSTTRTRVSCRKQDSSKASIRSICRHASITKSVGTTVGSMW